MEKGRKKEGREGKEGRGEVVRGRQRERKGGREDGKNRKEMKYLCVCWYICLYVWVYISA